MSLGGPSHITEFIATIVAPTSPSHKFVITVSQPKDLTTNIDSLCLTFPPITTNSASFY